MVDFREGAGRDCAWEGSTDGLPGFLAKFYFLICVAAYRVFVL